MYVGGSTAARNRNQPQSSLSSSLPPVINNNTVSSSVGGNSNNDTSAETLDDDMNMLANVFTAPHPSATPAVDVGEPVLGVSGDNKDDDDDSDDEYESDSEVNDELYSHPQDRGNPFLVSVSIFLSFRNKLRLYNVVSLTSSICFCFCLKRRDGFHGHCISPMIECCVESRVLGRGMVE